jgi:hypothetical protein
LSSEKDKSNLQLDACTNEIEKLVSITKSLEEKLLLKIEDTNHGNQETLGEMVKTYFSDIKRGQDDCLDKIEKQS